MSDGLEVETAVLRDAGRALLVVHGELDGARDTADVDGGVIAHDRLRERLRQFGSGWDRRRTEMAGLIAGLGRAAQDAADVYERIETELVAALAGER
ncbi:hypothetical protein [Blastococcus sp. SYSU DS0533]